VVFSWLVLFYFVDLLLYLFLAFSYLYTNTSVRILSRFYYPYRLRKLLEDLYQILVFRVLSSLNYMESNWENSLFEYTLPLLLIVFMKTLQKALLLGQVMVFIHPVINLFNAFSPVQL
jgi:hypothetical protein